MAGDLNNLREFHVFEKINVGQILKEKTVAQ